MSTATIREILAWDLKKGMRMRIGPDQAERRVVFVGSQTNRENKRPVFFMDDRDPWWVGSFTKVEIVEVEE